MTPEDSRGEVERTLKPLRFIVLGMAAGLLLLGVVFALLPASLSPGGSFPRVTIASVAFAIVALGWRTVMLRNLARRGRHEIRAQRSAGDPAEAARLLVLFRQLTITGLGLIEGPAFLALLAYFLERSPIPLGIAGLLWLFLVIQMPRADVVTEWLADQQRELDVERASGGLP